MDIKHKLACLKFSERTVLELEGNVLCSYAQLVGEYNNFNCPGQEKPGFFLSYYEPHQNHDMKWHIYEMYALTSTH